MKASSPNHKTKESYELKKSYKATNYQCAVEGILIALIAQHCTIEINKPSKKCLVTQQFIKVIKINFSQGDSINVSIFINNRCNERKEHEIKMNSDVRTATRRIQNYKRIETIHLLIDILREYGYLFKSKYVEGKKGVLKLENVTAIYYNNKLLLNIKTIFERGIKIINYLYHRTASTRTAFRLSSKNEFLSSLLYGTSNEGNK
ncbi:hypothetical protein ENUP19_0085G0088 [Entamoeba nuttalli]|uniref:Uncharacterized protein n=2 Tax=Entamoeba nuttalli TaxID=412467 RepID=K2GF25_ENTNP|nr:hypothetical protein ENU1_064630 [Entamoeba nuttalli P19]EKE41211.1 hypothetical protein ENU1_064630 [Entamoeba nuttalli P19]|eukprot:XP_008856456.1 hypothetical protein ENU1_064630 [Entamoeba nuttalli P19]